jgi:uncharacterized membrane protein
MLFTKEEEARIAEAIREAEQETTGEIRLFVEDFCLRDDPVERAAEVFQLFGMYHTAERNAVLIYLAEKSRHFAIWGDTGIHDRVGHQFWEAEKRLLRDHLQHDQGSEGVCLVVRQVGLQLQQYFPAQPGQKNDNELPDDVIYG